MIYQDIAHVKHDLCRRRKLHLETLEHLRERWHDERKQKCHCKERNANDKDGVSHGLHDFPLEGAHFLQMLGKMRQDFRQPSALLSNLGRHNKELFEYIWSGSKSFGKRVALLHFLAEMLDDLFHLAMGGLSAKHFQCPVK